MKNSDDLFEVIHKMTKSEKRYFKLSAIGGHGNKEKKYLKLFDILDSMEYYDAHTLKKALGNDPMATNLHIAKAYLMKLLQSAIVDFHTANSSKSEVQRLLVFAQILSGKHILKQAAKALERAKTIAIETESFEQLYNILLLEIEIEYKLPQCSLEKITMLFQEIESLEKKRAQVRAFHHLQIRFAADFQDRGMMGIKGGKSYLRHKLLQERTELHSRTAQALFYQMRFIIFDSLNEYDSAIDCINKAMAILSSTPRFSVLNADDIVRLHINKAILCLKSKRLHDFFQSTAELRRVAANLGTGARERLSTLTCIYALSFEILVQVLHAQDMKKGIPNIDELYRCLREGEQHHAAMMLPELYFHCALGYHLAQKYSKALAIVQYILSQLACGGVRNDIRENALVLQMVVHCDAANYELLPYLSRSVLRNSRNKEYLSSESLEFFMAAKRLAFAHSDKERQEIYSELWNKVQKQGEEEKGINYSSTFSLELWLQSKTEGISYQELLRKTYVW